jgi:hypothetical protein
MPGLGQDGTAAFGRPRQKFRTLCSADRLWEMTYEAASSQRPEQEGRNIAKIQYIRVPGIIA